MSTEATSPADTSPLEQSPLPNDLAVCHRMIQELLVTLHERNRELEGVRHRLDQLLRRLYGPRAERINPEQLTLFAGLLQPETAPAPAPEAKSEEAPSRHCQPHGRRKPPGQFPRERRVYE